MTRRQRNITILSLIALVIIILFILLFLRFKPAPAPVETNVPSPVSTQEQQEPERTPLENQQAEERESTASVQTVGKTFVERYGSYSNESNFANLRDLYPIMTEAFQAETEQFIVGTTVPESYYGITTRVITMNVDAYDESAGIAHMIVQTQREEAIDSPQNIAVRYQEIELTLERVNATWKVSGAQWN